MSGSELTRDEALRGRLVLWQPRSGYRFSIDALLLYDFAAALLPGPTCRVVDLGAGCGVIGLALAATQPALQVTLVELQPRLAGLCARNAQENDLAGRVTVVEADLRQLQPLLPGESAAVVVANPPFRPVETGRVSPDPERAVATAEVEATLEDVVQSAARLLLPQGTLSVIYPAERLPEVLASLQARKLRPARIRAVHPRSAEPARRVLVGAVKGGQGRLALLPPLVIHDQQGAYSSEVARILGDSPP